MQIPEPGLGSQGNGQPLADAEQRSEEVGQEEEWCFLWSRRASSTEVIREQLITLLTWPLSPQGLV